MTALAIDAPGAVALTQLSGRYVPPEVKKVGSISSDGGGASGKTSIVFWVMVSAQAQNPCFQLFWVCQGSLPLCPSPLPPRHLL